MKANHSFFLKTVERLCVNNQKRLPVQLVYLSRAIEAEADRIPASKDLVTAIAFVKLAKEIKASSKDKEHSVHHPLPHKRLKWLKKIRNLLQAQEEMNTSS